LFEYIPDPLEDARFRKSERFIIKAYFFIKGFSLKKKCNAEYYLLSLPQRTGLETLYAALLILRRTLQGCILLDNAGAIILNNHSLD
jgi:hypothetical protein